MPTQDSQIMPSTVVFLPRTFPWSGPHFQGDQSPEASRHDIRHFEKLEDNKP